MPDILKWGEIAFYVKPSGIRGVKDIQITGKCETEDEEEDKEKSSKKKNADKYEVSLTAMLNAFLGEDVQKTAMRLVEAARTSQEGYIYTRNSKLFSAPFMLTSATVSNLEISPAGVWLMCDVKMTLEQSSKMGGAKAGKDSGQSAKESVRSTPPNADSVRGRAGETVQDGVKLVAEAATNRNGLPALESVVDTAAAQAALQQANNQRDAADEQSERMLANAREHYNNVMGQVLHNGLNRVENLLR